MNTEKQPHMVTEIFLSLFKWFLLGNVVIILAILAVFQSYIHKSFNSQIASIEMTQDGQYNNQAIANG